LNYEFSNEDKLISMKSSQVKSKNLFSVQMAVLKLQA